MGDCRRSRLEEDGGQVWVCYVAMLLPDVRMYGGDSWINELDLEGRGLGWGYKFGIH